MFPERMKLKKVSMERDSRGTKNRLLLKNGEKIQALGKWGNIEFYFSDLALLTGGITQKSEVSLQLILFLHK